jgi:hypothetical protein
MAGEGVSHTLPDGAVISVPPLALASVGEALFDPCGMHGQPAAGLTDEILVSVKACINDYRRQMCVHFFCPALLWLHVHASPLSRMRAERACVRRRLESVIVCGGGRGFKGLEARLLKELTAAAPAAIRPVRAGAAHPRAHASCHARCRP